MTVASILLRKRRGARGEKIGEGVSREGCKSKLNLALTVEGSSLHALGSKPTDVALEQEFSDRSWEGEEVFRLDSFWRASNSDRNREAII